MDHPSQPALASLKVFVRRLELQAEIGVYPHERGRAQPLVVDIELDLSPEPTAGIGDTVNYETLAAHARQIAAEGHVELVETFATCLAFACLSERRALRARVRIEKPQAIPGAEAAGVEVVMGRSGLEPR